MTGRLKGAAAVLAAMAALSGPALAQEACIAEIGADDAQLLVQQCIEVSPATRPPCNVDNPCLMMIEEIIRGCQMLEADAPAFCEEYDQ
jgi:hypothetical protein